MMNRYTDGKKQKITKVISNLFFLKWRRKKYFQICALTLEISYFLVTDLEKWITPPPKKNYYVLIIF